MQNPTSLLSGRKVRTSEEDEEERREIMSLRVATTFKPAAQGQSTHSARTNNFSLVIEAAIKLDSFINTSICA